MRFLLLLLVLPLWSAEDANAILRRLVEAQKETEKKAQQYTFVEDTERFEIDKEGKSRQSGSERHEVIFVEGLKYRKLVARNGKPLGSREQAQVEKEMRQTAEDRRRRQPPSAPGGAVSFNGPFTHQSADLGSLNELLTLFDNRLAGQEEVRGHKTWVIESTPPAGHVPASVHEKQVLSFRKKFWIDQAENVLVRAIYTIVVDGMFMRPGSSLTFDYEKVDPGAWETTSLVIDFSRSKDKIYRPTGRTVYAMTRFQKFDVQSTITVGGADK